MNEPTLSHWLKCLDTYLPRRRPKYTLRFRCDCGWSYRWKASELIAQHKCRQEIICLECGDVYHLRGGSIVAIIPNPLNRSLVSEKTIVQQMTPQDLLDRHHHAAQGFDDFYERFYRKLEKPAALAAE
ncbi:hypothetical protein [Bradyrhizobium sp. SYSU BS000235]|uniref:hypothetical protein n=1 Tax=Bradyrhizobium sp. SYSU BS000235 TaxID=3411332 RepID=UPI003C78CCE3